MTPKQKKMIFNQKQKYSNKLRNICDRTVFGAQFVNILLNLIELCIVVEYVPFKVTLCQQGRGVV